MNPLESIHWLDLTILSIAILGTAIGAWRGVLRQTIRLVIVIIAFYVAYYLRGPVAALLQTHLSEVAAEIPRMHSFLGTFVIVYLPMFGIQLIVRKAIFTWCTDQATGAAIQAVGLGKIDRLCGAGLGLLVSCLLMGTALLGVAAQPNPAVEKTLAGSTLRPYLRSGIEIVLVAVPQNCKDELGVAMDQLQNAGKAVANDLATDGIRKTTQHIRTLRTAVQHVHGNLNSTKERNDGDPAPLSPVEDPEQMRPSFGAN